MFTASKQPITATVRIIQTEHVLSANEHRFEMRRETEGGSARIAEMGADDDSAVGVDDSRGRPYTIDDRNRSLDVRPPPPATPSEATRAKVSATPFVADLTELTYPEHAIRKNETFAMRIRRKVLSPDMLPSDLAIDVTFTVTKVEPTHIELSCKGTQVETSMAANKKSARAELELTCRGRIDRRDGRSARWWIDSIGTVNIPGEGFSARTRMHYDVTVGDTDPAVCERAKEE